MAGVRVAHRLIMTVMSVALSVRTRPLAAILFGGFIAGVLDLAYAVLVYSPGKPILIPQTIASGILGERSFQGGIATAVLGIVLHFVIALLAAAVFYWAARKAGFLIAHAAVAGLAYGAVVYIFMHAIVLPLSAVPHNHMPLIYRVWEFIEHCFCVGLPIALSVRHFSQWKLSSSDRHAIAEARFER